MWLHTQMPNMMVCVYNEKNYGIFSTKVFAMKNFRDHYNVAVTAIM